MARIRTIKPGFFANEGLSEVSEPAQILAGGLLCYADDEGYFNAHPGLIKAAVFPLRQPSKPIPELLAELAKIGYVRFGTAEDGKRYGFVVNFAEHQKVSHLTRSKIKKMEIVWEVSGKTPEASVSTPEVLRPELNRIELNRIEGKEPSKPSARKARGPKLTDIRYHHCVEILHRYWDKFAKESIRFELWFDAAGGKQLKNILARHTAMTVEEFTCCVANRARSPNVKHGEPFYLWGGHILEWVGGPKGNGNGNYQSTAAKRDAANVEALVRSGMGAGIQDVHVDSVAAVQDRIDDSGRKSKAAVASD